MNTAESHHHLATKEQAWQQRLEDLEIVRRVAIETPLIFLDQLVGRNNTIALKLESQQPVKSFKLRGPYLAMATEKQKYQNGVVANSAGNHAQGVALAGRELGIPVDIFMPATTPANKRLATVAFAGANFNLYDNFQDLEAAKLAAKYKVKTEGKTYLSPYNDERIIRGNASSATEAVIQVKRQNRQLDGVFVSVGGGGLLSGVADVNHEIGSPFELYGVEPEGANSGSLSFGEKEVVSLEAVDTTAEGLAVAALGSLAHQRILEKKVTDMKTVTLASVGAAYEWYQKYALPALGVDLNSEAEVWENMPEVSAMVALAGALEHLQQPTVSNETHLVIISGGNVDKLKVEQVLDAHHFATVSLKSRQHLLAGPTKRAYIQPPLTLSAQSS